MFIGRLSFQAIRCSLAEVGHVNKEWSSDGGTGSLTRELETGEAMLVECVVVEKMKLKELKLWKTTMKKKLIMMNLKGFTSCDICKMLETNREKDFLIHVNEERSQQSVEKLEYCKNNDREELVISSLRLRMM